MKFSTKTERLSQTGFFDDYLIYSKHQESPEDFHLWVAINMISTILGRKCYMDRGYYKLYPNTYVVLVGESAVVHKSTAINMGKYLLQDAIPSGLHFFSQKGTSEGLRNYLSNIYKTDAVSACNITIPEFATFFGKNVIDPSLMHDITDFYDCPDERSYTTMKRGNEECHNICINMLAGTTIEWMRSCVPTSDLGGGFIARLLMVYRQDTPRENPFPEMMLQDSEVIAAKERCIHDLQAMNAMAGQFEWSPEGKSYFLEWFTKYRKKTAEIPVMQGYFGRKDSTLIKLAMISSASKNSSKIITEDDIILGLTWLSDNETSMNKVSEGLGQTETGRRLDLVYNKIFKNSPMPHSVLMHNMSYQMNAQDLKLIIETLQSSGRISSVTMKGKRLYIIGKKVSSLKGPGNDLS